MPKTTSRSTRKSATPSQPRTRWALRHTDPIAFAKSFSSDPTVQERALAQAFRTDPAVERAWAVVHGSTADAPEAVAAMEELGARARAYSPIEIVSVLAMPDLAALVRALPTMDAEARRAVEATARGLRALLEHQNTSGGVQ